MGRISHDITTWRNSGLQGFTMLENISSTDLDTLEFLQKLHVTSKDFESLARNSITKKIS
jgi:hypothetical protein